jgi:hypothetical protein
MFEPTKPSEQTPPQRHQGGTGVSLPPLVSDVASIVIRGLFTPQTITPAWMAAKGLINDNDVLKFESELLIPGEIHIFKTDWLRCEIQSASVQLSTSKEDEFERLRDIVVGVLRESPETPVAVMGINRMVHFQVPDASRHHAIGDALTPKEIWKDVLILPGMKSLTLWGVRPDLYAGRIEVRIEASNVVRPGVFLAYNDHFELTTVERQPESREEFTPVPTAAEPELDKNPVAAKILLEEWGASLARSAEIIGRVGSLGNSRS